MAHHMLFKSLAGFTPACCPQLTTYRSAEVNGQSKAMPANKPEIPTTPKKQRDFEKKYMPATELAQRWGVSESAIYHGKAESNKLKRVYFGRSLRFLRQEVLDFENRKDPLPA